LRRHRIGATKSSSISSGRQQIDWLTLNILAACEVNTIGAITPIALALEQALMALLAVSCPQFRTGFNERFARRLPALVGWANQLADTQGYCTICRRDAICEPEEISQ
jgi:hypothetical protein